MGHIKILSPEVAQKIAAGEVIERPFSVVKELVENSLDAGATEIRVDLIEGGKKLIKVEDNGSGMSQEDVILCFQRHATSKISQAEDLEKIATLGFRGEALASIDAVSRLVLKTSEGHGGFKIEREGGRLIRFSEAAYPRGTIVEVRDLFFNLPARRKFLRSASSELALIVRYLMTIALAFPEVAFTLTHSQRQLLNCSAVRTRKERLYQLFGREAWEKMLELDWQEGDYQINGFISRPPKGLSDKLRQLYYVNRRPVKDRIIAAAVQQGAKNWFEKDNYPEVYLFLNLPFTEVDVNVHPAKAEVRFRDSGRVFQLCLSAVDETLKREAKAKEIYLEKAVTKVKEIKEEIEKTTWQASILAFQKKIRPESVAGKEDKKEEEKEKAWQVLGQYLNFYIVVGDEEGLLIIDQHNAHERILYEQYAEWKDSGGFARRQPLFPLLMELNPAEIVRLEEIKAFLEEFGFEIENLGGRSLLVRSLPEFLEDEEARQILLAVLRTDDPGAVLADPSERLLATMACQTAIKAGAALSLEKMEYLVKELFRCHNPWLCPHGRPTTIRLNRNDIERGLKRGSN
ncbi:MAG: DNA mismatch repair endonuclease MutL [Candidatus Aminicenantes bacterium]|nr:DNA mismatch repair endonuclease MutL [Candidatus Aminicenantes bacterium]